MNYYTSVVYENKTVVAVSIKFLIFPHLYGTAGRETKYTNNWKQGYNLNW